MKFVKFTAVALFAALVSAGCADEKISFGGEDNTPISTKGYLSISNLAIDCRIDEENPDTSVDPSVSTFATRTSVNVNNFDCTILNAEGEVVKSFKFGERPTENIEFEAGDYLLKVQSGEIQNAAWDAPVYGAIKPFKIVRKETTTLSEIVCSLQQIKVTVTYAVDLAERLGEGTTTTVSIGENGLAYSLTESRAGYFLAPQASNTLDIAPSSRRLYPKRK